MRGLKTSDLFAFGRCIRQIGLKDELKEIGLKANSVNDISAMGFDVAYGLFEKACEKGSEKPIYEFIAALLECKWEEVRDMDPLDLFEKLKGIANWQQWKGFFKTAARLT